MNDSPYLLLLFKTIKFLLIFNILVPLQLFSNIQIFIKKYFDRKYYITNIII